jgi:hypothetical protein
MPEKGGFEEQNHTQAEQSQNTPEHKLGAPVVHGIPGDPDLAEIVAAWPDLPDDVKREILEIVQRHSRAPGR